MIDSKKEGFITHLEKPSAPLRSMLRGFAIKQPRFYRFENVACWRQINLIHFRLTADFRFVLTSWNVKVVKIIVKVKETKVLWSLGSGAKCFRDQRGSGRGPTLRPRGAPVHFTVSPGITFTFPSFSTFSTTSALGWGGWGYTKPRQNRKTLTSQVIFVLFFLICSAWQAEAEIQRSNGFTPLLSEAFDCSSVFPPESCCFISHFWCQHFLYLLNIVRSTYLKFALHLIYGAILGPIL